MATKKYLHGNLNQDVVKPNYGGSETSSVKITVDNQNMTISGEVKWDDALGEVAHKAYPGDKGARNYLKITQLTEALEAEVKIAESHRSAVESRVGYIDKHVEELENLLQSEIDSQNSALNSISKTIQQKITTEATRAITAEKELLEVINEEIHTRSNITDVLESDIEALSKRVEKSISTLTLLIEKASVSAETSVSELESHLIEEIQRSTNADKSIKEHVDELNVIVSMGTQRVDQLSSDVEAVDARIDTIQELLTESGPVNKDEFSSLEADVSTLRNELETISSEAEVRFEDIENSILLNSTQVEFVESKITTVENELNKLSNDIDELHTRISNITGGTIDSEKIQSIESQLETVLYSVEELEDLMNGEIQRSSDLDDEHTSQLQLLSTNVQSLNSEVRSTISTVQKQRQDININKSDIQLLREQLNSLRQEIELIQGSIDNTTDDRFNELEESIHRLESDIMIASSDIDIMVDTLYTQSIRLNRVEDALETIIGDAGKLKSLIDTIQSDVTTLESQLDKTNKRLDDGFDKIYKNVDVISSKINSTDNDIISITNQLVSLSSQTKNLTDSIKELRSNVNLNVESINNLDSTQSAILLEVEKISEDLAKEIKRSSTADADTKTDISNLTETSSRVTNSVQDLSTRVTSIESDLKKATTKVNAAEEEQSRISTELLDLTAKINNVESDINNLNSSFDTAVEDLDSRINTLEQQLVDNINDNVSELDSRIDALELSLTDVHTDLLREQSARESAIISLDSKIDTVATQALNRHDIILERLQTYAKQSYVDQAVAQLIDAINSIEYDFIDGGNAPID